MVAIKVFFLSECRRAKNAPADLDAFKRYLFEVTGSRQTNIKYKDEEGDLVSIATNEEYLDYVKSCEKLATFFIDFHINSNFSQSSSLFASESSSVNIIPDLPFKSNDESASLESSKVLLSRLSLESVKDSCQNSNPELLDSIRNRVKEEISKKNAQKPLVRHSGVTCSACHSSPIIGIRYKCSECPVNFCEDCEESKNHEHPFFKIRASEEPESFRRAQKIEHDSKALRYIREKVVAAPGEARQEVEGNLKRLCEMGFSKESAVQALSYSKNNFQSALNMLLSQS